MSNFLERLTIEYDELTDRIVKLGGFLDGDKTKTIDKDQLTLLNIQLKAMITYQTCLDARIERL
jgi:hypothetical protein